MTALANEQKDGNFFSIPRVVFYAAAQPLYDVAFCLQTRLKPPLYKVCLWTCLSWSPSTAFSYTVSRFCHARIVTDIPVGCPNNALLRHELINHIWQSGQFWTVDWSIWSSILCIWAANLNLWYSCLFGTLKSVFEKRAHFKQNAKAWGCSGHRLMELPKATRPLSSGMN